MMKNRSQKEKHITLKKQHAHLSCLIYLLDSFTQVVSPENVRLFNEARAAEGARALYCHQQYAVCRCPW